MRGKKHDCDVSFDIKDQMPYNCLAHTNNVTPKKCETICNNNGDCAHYSFNPVIIVSLNYIFVEDGS